MEVGDIYFPFVCLLHRIFCLIFIFANYITAHLQVIWSFPTELCVAALVGADYWMHGWYGQPLEWPDCPIWIVVDGYFVIPSSREEGEWGDDSGMTIIFIPPLF